MTGADLAAMRERVVTAILANPVASPDEALARKIADPDADVTFEALGFDSLARMEFCIFLECEFGIAISAGHLRIYPSINAMAGYLAG